jgi:D-aspartate ligase
VNFSKTEPDLAIIVGGFVNGLGLARALSTQNRKIIVITTTPHDIAHHSKYVSGSYHLSDLELFPEILPNLLIEHANDWLGAVVFPTNDEAITSLSLFRERLGSYYRLAIPPPDAVPYILNKTKMLQAAKKVGIQNPKYYQKVTAPVSSIPGLEFPVVIKPVKASEFSLKFNEKLFVARNSAELLDYTTLLSTSGLEGEIFDLIPGPDNRIYAYCVYMDENGDPVAECTIRKLRQSPPAFGIARVAELTDNIPLLREQSIELLRHIGFRGIGVSEFKQDERDEAFRFFEVNGRSVVYNTLLRQANLDVARLTWSDHVEGQVKRVETSVWPGVWINLHADLLRSLQNCRTENLTMGQYLKPYTRQKTFAVWSARDPKPFFAQWSQSLRYAPSILTKGLNQKVNKG